MTSPSQRSSHTSATGLWPRLGAPLLWAAPLAAHAASLPNPLGPGTTIIGVIDRIIDFAVQLVVPLSVVMVLLAGLLYLTSGGSEEKVKRAHKALLWAIVGTAVVLAAKSVILVIKDVLGGV